MNDIKFLECPSCGARVTDDKKFCDYCGGKLTVPEEKKKSTEVDSQSSQVKPQEYTRTVYVQQQQPKTTSGLAVAAFIMSLFGFSLISLFMGIAAKSRISQPDSNLTGSGFAIAAIVISAIQTVFWVIWGISVCSIAAFY